MNVQQISFGVSPLVYKNLEKRAAPLNIRPTEYARRLFGAAYTTRVALERGEQTEDPMLDNQVRQVFLLADCEPEYIAEALGMPQALAEKILQGWRRAVKELDEPTAKVVAPEAKPTSLVPPPVSVKTGAGYSPQEVSQIGKLWREGVSAAQIARAIGRPFPGVTQWIRKHRDVCPRRGG